MGKSVKGTQTEKNLLTAFAGESQARNRYTFFASVARKEGYEQIANIFTETAGNEKEHAEVFDLTHPDERGGDQEQSDAEPGRGQADLVASLHLDGTLHKRALGRSDEHVGGGRRTEIRFDAGGHPQASDDDGKLAPGDEGAPRTPLSLLSQAGPGGGVGEPGCGPAPLR